MIFFDVLITIAIFIITGLGSAAFLNIAFTGEGSGTVAKNSKAGGAVLARRVFAATIIVSTFLFAVPILFLLGVYSEWFARVSLSWGLSIAVTWCSVVLPLLVARLGIARILFSTFSISPTKTKTMRLVAFVSWIGAFLLLAATWYVLVFATADQTNLWSLKGSVVDNDADDADDTADGRTGVILNAPTTSSPKSENINIKNDMNNDNDDDDTQQHQQHQYYQMMSQNKHTPFSCRFTGNDVHVLKRSGILPGGDVADGTLGSKSSSMSSSLSKANQERMLGKLALSNSKKHSSQQQQQKKNKPKNSPSSSFKLVDGGGDASASTDNKIIGKEEAEQQNNIMKQDPVLSSSSSAGDNLMDKSNPLQQQQQQQQQSKKEGEKTDDDQTEQKFILTNREILSDLQQNACSGFRDSFLARIALAGAVCVAALSGFAAISTPVDNLLPYLRRNSEREAQNSLNRLQRRLKNVIKRWGAVSQEGARLSWQLRELTMVKNSNNNTKNGSTTPPPPKPPPPLQPSINNPSSSNPPNHHPLQNNNNNNGAGGWFSKAKSFISNVVSGRGGSMFDDETTRTRQIIEKRLEEVTFEIAGYRYLTNNLLQAIESTSMTLEVASMGKSRGGKLRAVFGICLSLFGAAKTINLLISVLWRKLSGEDAATAALRNFVTMFSLQGVVDVAGLASKISLVLNMFLVVGSVRGFLILMFRLTQSKKSPSSSSSSSVSSASHHQPTNSNHDSNEQEHTMNNDMTNNNAGIMEGTTPKQNVRGKLAMMRERFSSWWVSALLFGGPQVDFCPGTLSLVSFSLFMGLHFLGAFVLLRLGFPAKSRGIIIDAVGTVPFVPCHSVHDVSFLVSVALTGVILRSTRVSLDEDDDDADAEHLDDVMMSSGSQV